MSMVSPEYYIEEITKDKTYKELIKIREEFIASFESFEEEYGCSFARDRIEIIESGWDSCVK